MSETFLEDVSDARGVKAAGFSPNGQLLACGFEGNELRLYAMDGGRVGSAKYKSVKARSSSKKQTIRVVAWSKDNEYVATGGEDNTAR